MKKILPLIFIGCCLFFRANLHAQNSDSLAAKKFELSFGSSQLFISPSDVDSVRSKAHIVLPTSAMLILAEVRPTKIFRIPIFFSLPTESKQFLVNGQLISERASPTFGSGVQFRCFKLGIAKKVRLEFEAGALGSVLFTRDRGIRFAPIGAGRLQIIKDSNFVMYLGSSYSVGINAFGLIYGTGFMF